MSTIHDNRLDIERDSDDEDDEDYVPLPEDAPSEVSEGEREQKRPRIENDLPRTQEDQQARRRARDALWASFQASEPPRPSEILSPKKMVKVQKRYRFAGDNVTEVVEVPEDSPEAEKWPRWRPVDTDEPSTSVLPDSALPPDASMEDPSTLPAFSSSSTHPPAPTRPPPAAKRPGPRKGKVTLPGFTTMQKVKKLTTLDKSAMDWRAHVQTQEPTLKDELNGHRRGGGYLEKVAFMQRVDERKDDLLEANKTGKRRRG